MRSYAVALSVLCATLLAACGERGPEAFNAVPAAAALGGGMQGAWMSPAAKNPDLLYIATGDDAYIVTYPGGKLVGALGLNFASSLCTDRAGNVFFPVGKVVEYQHGSLRPSRVLDTDNLIAVSCAVDRTTNDLAVMCWSSGASAVLVYPNEQMTPVFYGTGFDAIGQGGYDDKGDLFVDGNNSLAELRKGSSEFAYYSLDYRFDPYGAIQWDGTHMTISRPSHHEIYRIETAGSSLKIIGTTHLRDWHNPYNGNYPFVQTWIQGGTFIAQDGIG
ncbi:MAG: hypothetical protein WCD38_13735, partial [Candidatus Tumulicola sp.]